VRAAHATSILSEIKAAMRVAIVQSRSSIGFKKNFLAAIWEKKRKMNKNSMHFADFLIRTT